MFRTSCLVKGCLGFLTAALVTSSSVKADGFDYLKQALDKLAAAAEVGADRNLDYDGSGCLFGYFMDNGSEQTMIRTLEADTRYVFVGSGDNDVKDLDIKLYDMDDNKVAEDVETDATPVVSYTPRHDGRYKIVLRNHDSGGVKSFCAFIVLSDASRGRFQGNAVTQALENALEWGRMQSNLRFPSNQLIMFGGKVEQGSTTDVFDIQLPRGHYVFLARANDVAEDIDTVVTEQDRQGSMEGEEACKDDSADSIPICEFNARRNTNYAFTIKNHRSSRPAFMFGLIVGKDNND